MKKVTVWKILKGDTKLVVEHNHIEDGHVEGTYPQPLDPKFKNQLSWKNFEWQKEFSYLDENNKVIL
ncbi:hypothetical protein D3C87_82480 [compost metagenome]